MKRLKSLIVNWMADVLPTVCPFARPIYIFGHHLFDIPPICKINPFYEDVIEEKLRRLGYK